MKTLVLILLRFATYSNTLNAVSIVGGESMDRAPIQPIFDTSTENVTAIAGETAELRCTVENKGSYNLIWLNPRKTLISKDDSRFIDDSRISVERPNIRYWNIMVREVRYNDSGEYMCQINTKPVLIKRIILNIKVAPEIIEDWKPTKFEVQEGKMVELVCNATGVPMPVVTWYREANLIRDYSEQPEGERTLQGETLRLHNITRFCDGTYECNAENGVPPIATKIFKITVQFPPEVRLTVRRLGQAIGRETLLECKVAASPHATIQWTHNGTTLPLHLFKYVTNLYNDGVHEKTLTLNIIDIQQEDFGQYTCHASNGLGQDSETMLLYEYNIVTGPRRPQVTTTPWRPSGRPPPRIRPPSTNQGIITPSYYEKKQGGRNQQPSYGGSVYYNYNTANGTVKLTTVSILNIAVLLYHVMRAL
ncbi:protein amalgam-like isoform X1 [Mya arenaria]|uniref:protein amalgam-like isoform X1 n=1 Tax=Mya arenaria TaxID=6604 RepID=UPI0022DF0CD7|nr:protein amalgam-like isoform X1 [Mya arenaria]